MGADHSTTGLAKRTQRDGTIVFDRVSSIFFNRIRVQRIISEQKKKEQIKTRLTRLGDPLNGYLRPVR